MTNDEAIAIGRKFMLSWLGMDINQIQAVVGTCVNFYIALASAETNRPTHSIMTEFYDRVIEHNEKVGVDFAKELKKDFR